MHVATTNLAVLLDYVMNTPADGLRSAATVQTILSNIENNQLVKKH
jgi:4-O-beta-D-mannosyl-D-glucose phosphorylase